MRQKNVIFVKDSARTKTIVTMVSIIAGLVLILILVITLWAKSRNISEKVSQGIELLGGSQPAAQVVHHSTSIEEIVGINELHTLEYKYEAICRVYATEADTSPAYYISYTGSVTLGIDADKISTDYGKGGKKVITLRLPQIEIKDMSVNAGTLDYLFVNHAYNNQQTSIEAQRRCEDDLKKRVESDEKMFDYAKRNTESQVRAMTQPLVNQLYPDYTLEIVWKEG